MSSPSGPARPPARPSAARSERGSGHGVRVVLVAGTRPEVVKLAPVWHEARRDGRLDVRWLSTAQHGALERATLADVGVEPDARLDPRGGAGLADATAELLARLAAAWDGLAPDLVLVQGDTTSAFAAALAAFHARIPVAHVEAGLRSFDAAHPFPEEANRRMIAALAAIHLAPTEGAAAHLRAEGLPHDAVLVVGNPGVDAQRRFAGAPARRAAGDGRTLLVTLHRRESWEVPLAEMCDAVAELVAGDPALRVVWPVHVQPAVRVV